MTKGLADPLFKEILRVASFLSKFLFVEADEASQTPAIRPPANSSRSELLAWAASLPDAQMPTWLGLPSNAEAVLLTSRAKVLCINMLKLQLAEDDDIDVTEPEEAQVGGAPVWMRNLQTNCESWLKLLPKHISTLKRSAEAIKDPLFRFFERENHIGCKLLSRVHSDLKDVIAVCVGEKKQTNSIRALLSALVSGMTDGVITLLSIFRTTTFFLESL